MIRACQSPSHSPFILPLPISNKLPHKNFSSEMRFHIAALTILSTLIALSSQSPVRVQLGTFHQLFVRTILKFIIAAIECSNFGYIENIKCVCLKGMEGKRCEQVTATLCVDGICPKGSICHFNNVDCLFTPNCLDKRGWCLPLNFPPMAQIDIDQIDIYSSL
ncbi:hypothetical protein PRIPAC_79141 [Pristionchus pacificus]|uniref:Uncharacterized protein n=1 Tax=Pristionchus pacificus TaxID=54126 RepID=A0A2A6C3N6_PRIPA|nr:hypothetical protein PRIPAC_79141 [Pristionchus pacificus]|eukprot:PDM72717.1 hypothetical protein PRIPAC_39151 [Pristionchus pacificus]